MIINPTEEENNEKNKNLEKSQNQASEIGDAENNPQTSAPAGDLRKAALEATSENDKNDEKEPV